MKDYFNTLRIKEAMKRLEEDSTGSVLTISMDVGFNSHSTFYSRFKKIAGMTPNQYKKQAHTQEVP